MSFYRTFIAAVAAMGLATAAFATDETANNPQTLADASSTTTATQPADANQTAADQQTTKVDVNKASAKELSKVKGLNMTKAKAIVAYRKKHGDFKSLDDLRVVKGFKKMKDEQFKNVQDQLTVG